MRKLTRTAAVAIALVIAPLMAATVNAAPLAPPRTTDDLKIIQHVQFVWGGRNYCWYDDGWNGPGWYWCGYAFNRGYGWGGGYGWHSWRGGHPRAYYYGRGYRGHVYRGGRGYYGGHVYGGGHRYYGGHGYRGGHGGHGGTLHAVPNSGAAISDIRLKEDIVPLARLDNGIELYRFRYKGSDHNAYVGVMAQQVQQIEPSAVSRDRDGYLLVNYDRLGLRFMTWDQWLRLTGVSDRR